MDALGQLLAGEFRDPEGGAPLVAPIRTVVLEDSLAGREADLVAALDLGRRLAVVSDPTTRAVLGRRIEQALGRIADIESIVLSEHPEPDLATVNRLRRAAAGASALLAVGSGTINDLCKYAAAQAGLPFAVFATAPSMNGYTSVNAAINTLGHKRSLAARPAAGVFFDLEVLAAAPVRLIRAGLGDSLCRSTAQADWLLAHLLLGRPYRQAPFALLAGDEGPLLAASAELVAGDPDTIRRLVKTLVLSGFGMAICGGSEPASQGEHLISHYAEMLDGPPPLIEASRIDQAALVRHFGPELGHSCWQEFRKKRVDPGAAIQLNHRIRARWDEIRTRIAAIHKPAEQLRAVLERAGAPTTPEALGWPQAFYRQAVRHARLIRNRYGFLDLAADGGRSDLLG